MMLRYIIPAFIILLGVLLLLKGVFHLKISVSRIAFGVLFLWLAFSLMFGGMFSQNIFLFQHTANRPTHSAKYDVIFSQNNVDLTDAPDGASYDINCVFGETVIIVPKDAKIDASGSGAFCQIRFADKGQIAFGSENMTIGPQDASVTLRLRISAVFSEVRIIEAQ